MKVGIVSSVTLDDATPAAFYAHSVSRSAYYDIALRETECACMNAPLSDLLGDFVSEKEQLGRASEYTRHISARVLALVKECGWQCLRDVNADSFRKWRKGKAASAKTLNEYQNAVVALLNWVGKTKGVKVSVFDSVEHIDARGRKSFERRALTAPEARALLACSPLQRRVAYALALFTGLRRGEIEALEWRDLSLDGKHPFVSVRASTTKNSKPARWYTVVISTNAFSPWTNAPDYPETPGSGLTMSYTNHNMVGRQFFGVLLRHE